MGPPHHCRLCSDSEPYAAFRPARRSRWRRRLYPTEAKFQQMYEKRHRIYAAGQMSVSICLLRRVNWSAISSMPAICGAWEAIRGNLKFGSERIPVHDFEYDFSDDKLRDSVGIKPPKMRAIVALTTWVLAFLPAALQAQDVPIIKDSEAAQYIGKNVEVRGLVVAVYTSKKGNMFLNFGEKYPNQTFTGYLPAGSELAGDRWTVTLQGNVIGITGTVELYQGKPEIKVMSGVR